MTLEQTLADAPQWQLGPIKQYTVLHGGLSNQSYLLETATERFVLRINNPQPERLGIDRHNELAVLNTIAEQSFAPQIAYVCPNLNYMISHFIDGNSFAQQAPSTAENAELLTIINTYQQLPFSGKTLHYGEQLRSYHQQLATENKLSSKLQADWLAFQTTLTQFEQTSWQAVLSHHDLVPENIIRSSQGLKIIDWEYASNGHPAFDRLHSSASNTKQERLDNMGLQHIIHWLERLWLAVNNNS